MTTLGGAKSSGGKKNNKLPLILGVTFASAFAVLASAFAAIWKKRQNAKSQSNSTVPNTSTGMVKLIEI